MTKQATDRTNEVLAEMLTENTGSHFLDSGGSPKYDAEGNYVGSQHGYGRAHERNRGRDFDSEPATVLKGSAWTAFNGEDYAEIELTHNVYHWLGERVTYDAELDALFGIFADSRPDDGWLTLMEEFPYWLYEQRVLAHDALIQSGEEPANAVQDSEPETPGGIYRDGGPFTVNTYNNEDALSQVLQYTYWSDDLEEHALIQIHGGADVRGGYTRPRAFEVSAEEYSIFDNARAAMFCNNDGEPEHNEGQETIDGSPANEHCSASWTTDDAGCSWQGEWNGPGWETHNVENIGGYHEQGYELVKGEHGEKGKVVIHEDGRIFCPVCGRSTLGAASF